MADHINVCVTTKQLPHNGSDSDMDVPQETWSLVPFNINIVDDDRPISIDASAGGSVTSTKRLPVQPLLSQRRTNDEMEEWKVSDITYGTVTLVLNILVTRMLPRLASVVSKRSTFQCHCDKTYMRRKKRSTNLEQGYDNSRDRCAFWFAHIQVGL